MYALGDRLYQAYGDQTNIKITTKEDLALFEGYVLLQQRKMKLWNWFDEINVRELPST